MPIISIIFVGFIIRLYFGLNYKVLSPDEVYYARIGEYIYQYHEYGILDVPGYPAIIQPPIYPALIAISRIIFPMEFAGKAISILLGTGIIGIVFFLALNLFSKKSALWSALLVAIHPIMIEFSGRFLTEITFLFFCMICIYAVWRYILYPKLNWAIFAVMSSGIAYLTRIEGILVMAVAIGIIIFKNIRVKKWHYSIISIFIISIFIIGYAAWSSRHIGGWVWIPKLVYAKSNQMVIRLKVRQDPQFLQEPASKIQKAMFHALAPNNKDVWTNYLFWKIVHGENIEAIKIPLSKKYRLLKMFKKNFRSISWLFYRRSIIPFGLLPFLIFALISGIKNKLIRKKYLFLLIWMIPFSYFLISHVEKRFLLGWIILFMIITGTGIATFEDRLLKKKNYLFKKIYLFILGIILIVIPDIVGTIQRSFAKNALFNLSLQLGKEIPSYSKVTTSRPMHAFYNNWVLYLFPYVENVDSLEEYIRLNNIEYLLVEHPKDTIYNKIYEQIFKEPKKYLNINILKSNVFGKKPYSTRLVRLGHN